MFIEKDNWKDALLLVNSQTIIKDGINSLNKSGLQIILVVNKKNKLIGTITDGDIRRSLLDGKTIDSQIKTIINKKPIYLNQNSDIISKKIKKYTSLLAPVVNDKLIVTGIKQYIKRSKPFINNTLIIMAGGKGTRLKDLTKNTPKPMLLFNNKPLLEHIIVNGKSQGINDYIISVNYLSNKIKNYFKSGNKLKVNISYVHEKKPLGTAGSLSLIKSTKNNPYIVINGDVLTNINFEHLLDFHLESKAEITIGIISYEYQIPYGVIEKKGSEFFNINEKPNINNFINAGVYVFNKNIFRLIEKNKKIDMNQLLLKLKKNNIKIKVFPIHENWIDIGLPSDYENLKKKYNEKY